MSDIVWLRRKHIYSEHRDFVIHRKEHEAHHHQKEKQVKYHLLIALGWTSLETVQTRAVRLFRLRFWNILGISFILNTEKPQTVFNLLYESRRAPRIFHLARCPTGVIRNLVTFSELKGNYLSQCSLRKKETKRGKTIEARGLRVDI